MAKGNEDATIISRQRDKHGPVVFRESLPLSLSLDSVVFKWRRILDDSSNQLTGQQRKKRASGQGFENEQGSSQHCTEFVSRRCQRNKES